MKTILKAAAITATVFMFSSSCEDSEISSPPVNYIRVNNLYAPKEGTVLGPGSGPFTKFNFTIGDTVADSSEAWDIALRTTSVAVNGGQKTGARDEPERTHNVGVALVDKRTFHEVSSAKDLLFVQDTVGAFAIPTENEETGDKGWYKYDSETHIVTAIPGRVWVFRTHDERYVKVEFISYYKDAPEYPTDVNTGRYYTFVYDFLDEETPPEDSTP